MEESLGQKLAMTVQLILTDATYFAEEPTKDFGNAFLEVQQVALNANFVEMEFEKSMKLVMTVLKILKDAVQLVMGLSLLGFVLEEHHLLQIIAFLNVAMEF